MKSTIKRYTSTIPAPSLFFYCGKNISYLLWQFSYCYDGKFCHLQELKIYQILLKTPLFRTLCRCIDLVSMRIVSLTLWQTRFSRKSHHVRFLFFLNFIYILSFYIISLFPQMQTRISKAFLFNHCQKPRIFNYNYGFYIN